jgi:peptidoglycan hydrolase-like protein with peptidoglycan-binding domain
MHKLLRGQSVNRWILLTLAAGSLMLPAARAQSAAQPKARPKAKSAVSSAASPSAKRTSSKRSAHAGKSAARRGPGKVKGQAAPTTERVNEIQQALAKNGSFPGSPSGKWDDSTVEAMKQFQSAHGLNPSGKIDALTLQKLGLGSETAGMGAPNIPPDSAANRLLSRTSSPSSQPE